MKARPIIFNNSMVRKILLGQKTQTRRIVATQGSKDCGVYHRPDGLWTYTQCKGVAVGKPFICPHGSAGDMLWVRETFCAHPSFNGKPLPPHVDVHYKSDYDGAPPFGTFTHWRPSIHMPHWASRLTLTIQSIRIERLQDISPGDIAAEGFQYPKGARTDPSMNFFFLWESIYGKFSVKRNPWVWVVEFRT